MGNNPSIEPRRKSTWKKKYSKRDESIRLRKEIKSIKEKDIEKSIRLGRNIENVSIDNDTVTYKRSVYKTNSSVQPSFSASVREKSEFVDPTNYEYPFENLVLEGGGSKGLSYLGVLQALKDCGILRQIRRFCGTSMGSIYAALLGVGMDIEDMKRHLQTDLNDTVYDAGCGILSLIPNLISKFGWNPGYRFYNWIGEVLAEITGDPDITFMGVYKMYGNELCVVVTNLNYMEEIYCHPKTTPDLPIRIAVRMSISIPGIFQAKSINIDGDKILCVDGGMLCNYPIHCFDGWWLSLERGDSFLERLQPLDAIPYLLSKSERFGTYNEKTLGVKCYSDTEVDMWRTILDAKTGQPKPEQYPNTHLSRKVMKTHEDRRLFEEHKHILEAMNSFLKALKEVNMDDNENITESELNAVFQADSFPKEHADRLFGSDVTPWQAFKALDLNGDGKISLLELRLFMEQSGISLQKRFLRFQKTEITGLKSFIETVYAALAYNMYRVFVDDKDIKRTIGINTGYVDSFKFKLEDADKQFLVQRGEHATLEYLKNYVVKDDC